MQQINVREEMDFVELGKLLTKRVNINAWQCRPLEALLIEEFKEDPSKVTSQEIIEKTRAFLAQDPNEVQQAIFLQYLAYYPVSMCKREVSFLLKVLIGVHYHMSIPSEKEVKEGYEKISYEDLTIIFVRSKATISAYVNETKELWNQFDKGMNEHPLQSVEEVTTPTKLLLGVHC